MTKKLLLILLLLPVPAWSAGLFEARVPVEDRQAEQRQAVLSEALQQVLVRATGRPDVVHSPAVRPLLESAGRFVQRYGYESGGDEQFGLWLTVQFDGPGLRRELATRGVPVWGREMPAVLAWVAVEQGAERFLLGADENPGLRHGLADPAASLGVSVLFPLLDLQDRATIRISDVWGGFSDTVLEASERYGVPSVLAGRMDQDATGRWRGRWQLYLSGEPQDSWQSVGESAEEALRGGAQALAGRLAERFAVVPNGRAEGLRLRVEDVREAADYAWLQKRLGGLAGVRDVHVERVAEAGVEFRLGLDVDPARIIRALELAERLRALPAAVDDDRRRYRLLP